MARPEIEPKTELGLRLRTVRNHLGGANRYEFASRLGISKSAVAMYERGDNIPTATILAAYHEQYGIDLHWLLTGKGEMFADPAKAPAPVLDQRLMRKLARIVGKTHKELNIKDSNERVAEEAAGLYNELRVLVRNISDPEEVDAALPLLTLSFRRKVEAEFGIKDETIKKHQA